MMEPGTYRAKVVGAAFGYSNSGNEQIGVKFETKQGDIMWYGYFSPAAMPYTLERLKTCGLPDNNLIKADEMVGTEVDIIVEHEEYDGKTRLKVQWINPIGGGGMRNPMDSDSLAEFARRIKEQADGAKKRNEAERQALLDDDDIAF